MARRWLAPEAASDIGRLDPEAIARVQGEAWPDPANADELHDALVWLGFLGANEAPPGWNGWFDELARDRRAARLFIPPTSAPASSSPRARVGWRVWTSASAPASPTSPRPSPPPGERAPEAGVEPPPAANIMDRGRTGAAVPDAMARGQGRSADGRAGALFGAGLVARGRARRDPARPAGGAGAGRRSGAGRAARTCPEGHRRRPHGTRNRRLRDARAVHAGSRGRRMVRAPAAGADPPLYRQPAARRDSAGRGARLPALSARLAAGGARNPHGGAGRARNPGPPARRFRGRGRRLGDRDPAGAPRRLRTVLARRSVSRRARRLGAAAAAQWAHERRRAQRHPGAYDADHPAGASSCRAVGVAVRG